MLLVDSVDSVCVGSVLSERAVGGYGNFEGTVDRNGVFTGDDTLSVLKG